MRVLIAFDKFKDALSAYEACAAAARALRHVRPELEVDTCPLTDGGEGFAKILTESAGGRLRSVTVNGPRAGQKVKAAVGFVFVRSVPAAVRPLLGLKHLSGDDTLAIVEMAAASGLALLPPEQRDPWQTTSLGTGQAIQYAVGEGARAVLLGVGGSATNDLGLGALQTLGLRFKTAAGGTVRWPAPKAWDRIAQIQGAVDHALPPLLIACDVRNPLLGPKGATSVYAPQKGLRPEDHKTMEAAAARMAKMLCQHAGVSFDAASRFPGAGAAGGIMFGLKVAAGARRLSGFDLVSKWLDVERRAATADIVITGEGRFDESSLQGKGPGTVVARALAAGKAVHVFAGQVSPMTPPRGLSLHQITPDGMPLARALATAESNLASAVRTTFRAA